MIRAACLLLAGLALCTQAPAQQPLPCEASAQCALQMARVASFKVFLTAVDARERKYALRTLTWAGQQDTKINGAALREPFASLRANIDALPSAAEKQQMLQALAESMAASDLIAEAQELAFGLTAEARDLVRMEAAVGSARRGRIDQAFALVGQIERDEQLRLLGSGLVVNALANAGRPDLVREAIKRFPNANPVRSSTMLAVANQVAGNHHAARAEVMRISDRKARLAALRQLLAVYHNDGPAAEALTTARLLAKEVGNTDNEILWKIIDTFADNRRYAEALKWLPAMAQSPRGRLLLQFAEDLTEPADIRAAEKLVPELEERDRADVRRDLLRARVASGNLTASAALEQADDRVKFAEELRGAAGDLFKRGRRAEAQETLRVAIAAVPENKEGFYYWPEVAAEQAEIGPFADARATIDREFKSGPDRGETLMILSGAQARDGLEEDAARTRAEALREFSDADTKPFTAERLLLALNRARLLDEAEIELRRLLDSTSLRMWFRHGPRLVIVEQVKRGQLPQAQSLAAALSQRLGDDPQPFVAMYVALTGAAEPSERSFPGGVDIN